MSQTDNHDVIVDSSTMNDSISSGYDTITIDSLDLNSIATIDLTSLTSNTLNYNYTVSNGAVGSSYTTNNTGFWSNSINSGQVSQPSLKVHGPAEFDHDVKIQGHSILHILKKIEDRLAILQEPDPEKLEKFAALKKAYDHYKTLESLIGKDWKEESKK